MKKTVYIIGPTTYRSQLNIADFRVIQTFLEREGYQSIKPHDLFDDMDNNILSQQEQMERRFAEIDKHPICIIMPDHYLCSYARAEVWHARREKKDVIHFQDWKVVMKRREEQALLNKVA